MDSCSVGIDGAQMHCSSALVSQSRMIVPKGDGINRRKVAAKDKGPQISGWVFLFRIPQTVWLHLGCFLALRDTWGRAVECGTFAEPANRKEGESSEHVCGDVNLNLVSERP